MIVDDNQVQILYSPNEYFDELRKCIQEAKQEIILSALYIGTQGNTERMLLDDLEKALNDHHRPDLKVTFILDHSRAQRGPVSSLTTLAPLVEKHPHRCKVYLYQMPLLRNPLAYFIPFQLREVLGVYHCKYCVIDNKAILTGANLSHEYFTTRQDRYWIITEPLNQSHDGCGMIKFLRKFSQIVGSDSSILNASGINHSTSNDEEDCKKKLDELVQSFNSPKGALYKRNCNKDAMTCLPIIQNASLSIHQEEMMLPELLYHLSELYQNVSVQLATPYTNFSPKLLGSILAVSNTGSKVEVIGPDSNSHGFATATGLKSYIPQLHETALLSSIKDALEFLESKSANMNHPHKFDSDGFTYHGYNRNGWTYHAKGIWFNADEDEYGNVCGTYIGSSNFGIRSWVRDFELGFVFIGSNDRHKKLQMADYISIRKSCTGSHKHISLQEAANTTANVFIRIAAKLVKSFL